MRLLLFCLTIAVALPAAGKPPLVAVASNMTYPVKEIVDQFTSQTGVEVRLSFGSSGNFTRQIRQGAPFEILLSADARYADMLHELGLTQAAPVTLARGRIGAFVPNGSRLESAADLDQVIRRLAHRGYARMAMANPEHAPFGDAARQALKSAGVWAFEHDRVLLAENVAQAVQFTLAGSVDVGFIPLSYAIMPQVKGKGRFFLIPESWHEPLEQRLVLLRKAGPGARSLYDFLQRESAREVISRFGYSVP